MNGINGFCGRAFTISVFDPEQISAAMVAGEQPVEKRCPGATDMQETGW